MNEKKLKELWEFLKKDNPEFMDFSVFRSKMDTPSKRKGFFNVNYSVLVSKGFFSNPNWTSDDFEREYGPQKPKPKTTPVILTPQDIWSGKVVEQGMEGDIVKLIQDQLKKKQLLKITTTTRLFGTLTKKAVVNFQNQNGIPVTGKVDSVTWNKLFAGTNYEEKKQVVNNPNPSVTSTNNNINKVLYGIRDIDGKTYKIEIKRRVEGVDNQYIAIVTGPGKYQNKDLSQGLELELYSDDISDVIRGNSELGSFKVVPSQNTPPSVNPPKPKETKGRKVIGLYGGLQEQQETKTIQDKRDMLNNAKTLKDDNGRTCFDKVITKLNLGKHPRYRDLEVKIEGGDPAYAFKAIDPTTDEVDDFYITSDGNRVYGYFLISGQEYDLECQTKSIPSEVQTIVTNAGWTFTEPLLSSEKYTEKKDIGVVFPRLSKYFPNGKSIWYTGGETLSSEEIKTTNELVTGIKNLTEINTKFCKDSVDTLWNAKEGSNRGVIYFTKADDLQTVRQYVKRCAKELEKNLFDKVLGSKTKDHYKVLVGMRHYDTPQSKFNLGENNSSLEKTIRKKLMEMKKIKSALIR